MKKFIMFIIVLACSLTFSFNVFALPNNFSGTNVLTQNAEYDDVRISGSLTVNRGVTLTANKLQVLKGGSLNIQPGATVNIKGGNKGSLKLYGDVNIEGTLKANIFDFHSEKTVTLQNEGILDVTFANNVTAKNFVSPFSEYCVNCNKNHFTVKAHNFEGDSCTVCGAKFPEFSASILSKGSIAIIVGIVALIIGIVIGFFIGKSNKKKEKH